MSLIHLFLCSRIYLNTIVYEKFNPQIDIKFLYLKIKLIIVSGLFLNNL